MIFHHSNYRDYLREYLRALPKRGHGEASKIAKHLKLSSTYVSHVFSGHKVLTPEQAQALAEYLGLQGPEVDYFFYLVQKERAGTEKLKKFCDQKLTEIKKAGLKLVNRLETGKLMTDTEKSVFYSNALYSAIHLFTSTGKSGKAIEDIAERFELPRGKVAEILSFLVRTALVNEKDGRYTMGTQKTHLENGSPHLLRHHANWRMRALQASESLSDEELMYTVNVSLSREDFALLREQAVTFIQKFIKTVHASPADEIACMNLDFFWIRN